MESLDRVALWVVHGSGCGLDVKGRHCDLKDMRNIRRPIVRVDNRRHTPVLKIISDQVLDHSLGLLILDRPTGEPSGIDVDDCEEISVSFLSRL